MKYLMMHTHTHTSRLHASLRLSMVRHNAVKNNLQARNFCASFLHDVLQTDGLAVCLMLSSIYIYMYCEERTMMTSREMGSFCKRPSVQSL